VVKKVVKVTSDAEPVTKIANTTVTKVVSDPKSKSGKKKKVVVKKVIKSAPKKKIIVKKPNVTNKTEEVDAILNDSEVVDKKNKIEYLENLEKDLEEATAKISKHKNELKVQKAQKIINRLNATNGTLPGSVDPITPDNVDKALEESKNIIKE
jgi:vacuolar-type H+-ATPase subunit I/STV1